MLRVLAANFYTERDFVARGVDEGDAVREFNCGCDQLAIRGYVDPFRGFTQLNAFHDRAFGNVDNQQAIGGLIRHVGDAAPGVDGGAAWLAAGFDFADDFIGSRIDQRNRAAVFIANQRGSRPGCRARRRQDERKQL